MLYCATSKEPWTPLRRRSLGRSTLTARTDSAPPGLLGADHIALGSDYPFPLGELEPGKLIRNSTFNDETKAKLLHGTALNWLGLSQEQFLT